MEPSTENNKTDSTCANTGCCPPQTASTSQAYHRRFQGRSHPVMISKYLTKTQICGAMRAGDVILPGDNKNFPKFSDTDFITHIDRMLDYMTTDDRDGLCLLLSLFAYTPKFAITFLFWLCNHHEKLGFLGTPLRMISIGVRGLFFTLYYSNLEDGQNNGTKIMKSIKWDSKIVLRDEDMPKVEEIKINYEFPNQEESKLIYTEARRAQFEIGKMTLDQRLRYIAALKDLIMARKEELISELQKDTLKSRTDALMSEIFPILDHLEFLLTQSKKALQNKKIKTPLALMGKKSEVHYAPMGTVLVISPWNYPLYQALVPITTSFVTGNATIYKPSEFTPLKGLVEGILAQAGFEPSWAQVVYGTGETGKILIENRPDKIFFTGSVATGKKIMAQASTMIIPVELELGGKDPMIVFEDANLERAMAGAIWGAMTNCGQSCTSVERLYLHCDIYEEGKEKLVSLAKRILQKTDTDGNSDIGPMTSEAQVKIVKAHLEDALAKGATQLTGQEWDGSSNAIPPIILENVTNDMFVATEESFGPLLPLFSFEDEAEVIHMANNSIYGLSASVWTKDKNRALRVTKALQTGNVSINNVMLTEGNHHLPFGGVKESGIGRYKGVFGLHSFSNLKAVLWDANSSKIEANWYPYTKEKYQLFSGMMEGLFGKGLMNFIKFAINGIKLESYAAKAHKEGRKK